MDGGEQAWEYGPGGGEVDPDKYARVERERRFLLSAPPLPHEVTATRLITDRYLPGSRMRLRRAFRPDLGTVEYKLTHKVPLEGPGAVRPLGLQGLITNTYLDAAEYDLIATLPAATLTKTRFSVPPLGVDVFDGHLAGLVLGEAEFTSDVAARDFTRPSGCVAEVTHDQRFTGGRLVTATRAELTAWLGDYGLRLEP